MVEGEDGVDNHCRIGLVLVLATAVSVLGIMRTLGEEGSILLDQLAGHGGRSQLAERFPFVCLACVDSDLLDLVDRHGGRSPQTLDDDL